MRLMHQGAIGSGLLHPSWWISRFHVMWLHKERLYGSETYGSSCSRVTRRHCSCMALPTEARSDLLARFKHDEQCLRRLLSELHNSHCCLALQRISDRCLWYCLRNNSGIEAGSARMPLRFTSHCFSNPLFLVGSPFMVNLQGKVGPILSFWNLLKTSSKCPKRLARCRKDLLGIVQCPVP